MLQKRIALFVNNLDEEYQISIFKAAREAAKTLGYQLICIQSETIFANKRQSFKFYSEPWLKVDGILFLSSVLGQELGKTEQDYISQLFKHIPCVSIGKDLYNFSSILIHSKEAFSSLIKHLVDTHGYRNILYIGGPEKHHDNIIREQVLVELTDEYNNKDIPIVLTIPGINIGKRRASIFPVFQNTHSLASVVASIGCPVSSIIIPSPVSGFNRIAVFIGGVLFPSWPIMKSLRPVGA